MGSFQRVYSDLQRDAIREAWGDRGIRPAERVAALAAAGELTCAGELVPAFHVPAQTVRDLGRKYLRKRAGLERSATLELPAADQVEAMRRRLVAAVDAELESVERLQARRREVSPERIRQLARAVRELAALPAPGAPAQAPRPERHRTTRGGLAGQILRADRSSGGAVQEPRRESNGSELEPAPEHEPGPELEAPGERINGADTGRNGGELGSDARADLPDAP